MAVPAFRHRQLTDAFYETIRSSGSPEEVEFRPWHKVRATSLRGIVGRGIVGRGIVGRGIVGQSNLYPRINA